MKTSVRFLAVVAFSATALPLMAGVASAQTSVQPSVQPSVIPSQGNEDAVTAISPRGQEKQYEEVTAQVIELDADAAAALNAGQYAIAEAEARQSVAMRIASGKGEELLASSLYAQGKTQEALVVYKAIDDANGAFPRNELPYAQLLLQEGQWPLAVAAYNKSLRLLNEGDLVSANSHFTPDVAEPAELAAAIQVGMGLTMEGGDFHGTYEARTEQALGHFQKALALEPDNALTNYYYGYGWQKLSPADRLKFGNTQQAKTALQKAVKVGNASVKKAAKKALKNAG